MLNLTTFGKNSIFYNRGFATWTTGNKFSFSPIVAFPSQDSVMRSIGIRPVTSEPGPMDDRECFHYNFRGNINCCSPSVLSEFRGSNLFKWTDERLVPREMYRQVYQVPGTLGGPYYQVLTYGNEYYYRTPTSASAFSTIPVTYYYLWDDLYVKSLSDNIFYRKVVSWRRDRDGSPYVRSNPTHEYVQYDTILHRYRRYTLTVAGTDDQPVIMTKFGSWTTVTSSYRRVLAIGDVELEVPDLQTVCDRFWGKGSFDTVIEEDPSQTRFRWGDLSQTAANGTRYVDINMSMYYSDFFKIGQLIKPFVALLRGNFSLKNLASAYLALHYGVNLTIRDTVEIAEAIARIEHMDNEFPYQVSRAMKSTNVYIVTGFGTFDGQRVDRLKLYYDPLDDKFHSKLREAHSWDWLPTAANIWDFIPFSFVVDWFVGISDELERWEHGITLVTLKVLSTLISRRDQFTVPADTLFGFRPGGPVFQGEVEVIRYSREILATPPQPISRLEAPQSFGHWIEGTALLIQRLL